MDIKKLQKIVISALEDVKAQDIQLFDTTGMTSMFDRIAVASGTSNRQTKALAMSVRDKVKEAGGKVVSMEGEKTGEWVLVDLGDMVVHVMQPAIRAYYRLEELWGEKEVKLAAAKRAPRKTATVTTPAKPAPKASGKKTVKAETPAEKAPKKRATAKPAEETVKAKAAKKSTAKKTVAATSVEDAPRKRTPGKTTVKTSATTKPKKMTATGTAETKKPAKKVAAAKKPAAKSTGTAASKSATATAKKSPAKRKAAE